MRTGVARSARRTAGEGGGGLPTARDGFPDKPVEIPHRPLVPSGFGLHELAMGGSPGLVGLAHFRDAVQEYRDLSEADRAGDGCLRGDCQGGGSLRRGKRKIV